MELEEKTGVSSGKTANPHWPTAGLLDYVQLMTIMIMCGEIKETWYGACMVRGGSRNRPRVGLNNRRLERYHTKIFFFILMPYNMTEFLMKH
jgi:hypothetical protein